MSRKRWLIRLGLMMAVCSLGLAWIVYGQAQKTLTVENQAGQSITRLKITIGGESDMLRKVRTGTQAPTQLRVRDDDRFTVEGQLADGTQIRGNGLATGAATMVILPGGHIKFRPSSGLRPF